MGLHAVLTLTAIFLSISPAHIPAGTRRPRERQRADGNASREEKKFSGDLEYPMDWQPIRFMTGRVLHSKLGSKKEVFTELMFQEAVIPPP
jgi:hypothetical protein